MLANLFLAAGLAGLSPSPQEVRAEARFEPAAAPAGSLVELHVQLTIKPGWHVYHPDQEPSAGAPTRILVEGEGFSAVGPVRTLAEAHRREERIGSETNVLLELSGRPQFVVPVWVTGAPGPVEAQVKIRYQACDARSCKPPATLTVAAPLERQAELPPDDPGFVPPGTRGGVTWRAELEPAQLQSGAPATLRLFAEVEAGWHLYHPLMDPDHGTPVDVAELSGALRPLPHAYLRTRDRVERHTVTFGETTAYTLWLAGAPEFRLPVQVDGAEGAAEGRVVVRWQTCSDELCNQAQRTELTVPVTFLAGGTRLPARAPETDPEPAPASEPAGDAAPAAGDPPPSSPPPVEAAAQTTSAAQSALNQGFLTFLLAAVIAALFSLATPCVFPMIPITVSFFTKRAEAGKGQPLPNALAYGAGIVFTFVGLGLGITALFGAGGVNTLAANPFLNLALGLLFVVFALSLLGLYDINPPQWLQARLSRATAHGQQKTGYAPVMLMAVAFSVTAFTCTVAFVGGVLALAARGAWFYALAGMTVFALVFAAPFVLLALFPAALRKLPQAGGWMEDVKVAMGFVEVIFALKFFSNADLYWDLELLTRPVVIALTAIPIFMWAFCLFRVFRTPHEFEYQRPGYMRVLLGVLALAAGGYVVNGLRGGPFAGALEGYFPPPSYGRAASGAPPGDAVHVGESVKLGPAELLWFENYQEAFAQAKEAGRPLFLDFTGVTCINCRRMEGNILPHELVKPLLEQCVRAELWVDKPPHGDWNKQFQIERFQTAQQPQYVVLDPRTDAVLGNFTQGYEPDPAKFAAFLRDSIAKMGR